MLCLGEVYGSQIMVRDPAFQSTNWRQRRGMIRQPEQTDSKSAISNVPSIPFFAAKDGVLLACGTKTMPHNYRKWRTSKLCLTAAGTTPAGMDGSDETEEGMNADVSIEYCTGCRWNLRSAWLMQELLTTFEEESNLHSVTMIPIRPPAPGGIFVSTFASDWIIVYYCMFNNIYCTDECIGYCSIFMSILLFHSAGIARSDYLESHGQ